PLRGARWLRHIDPGVAIALLAGECGSVYACWIERVAAGQRRNLHALSAARLKAPSVILAGQLPPIEPSIRQRNAAVRAAVSHGKEPSIRTPPQHQRNPQQHGRSQLLALQRPAAHRRIPVVIDKCRSRALRSRCGSELCGHRFYYMYSTLKLHDI